MPSDDGPWLTADQLKDWIALVALVSTLPAALDAQLKQDAGLNVFEYQVLAHLSEAPEGSVPMSDLALMSQGSPSRLSHAIARLERAEYVRRIACQSAGRRTATVLTESGRAKLEAVAPGHVREARRLVVDVLTPRQLAALGDAARAVVEATSPEVADALWG